MYAQREHEKESGSRKKKKKKGGTRRRKGEFVRSKVERRLWSENAKRETVKCLKRTLGVEKEMFRSP